MAKITSEILKKIAPQTKAELRDRFLPYLNEALPRYGIVNELQVAGFLATAAFESQYFQKTKEGRAKSTSPIWIKYQSKYWHTNFMGRGIFQTTHEKNYRTFGQKMKKKGLVTDSELFVRNPALLEQPQWAVESACEYWETNGLDKYALQGFKGFSALQGKVNKGSPLKVAHDYPNRLMVYERTRLALPDDFLLGTTISGASTPSAGNTAVQSTPIESTPQNVEPPPTQIAEQIINTGDATNTPPPEDKTLEAPVKDGATVTATKTTILGLAVPPTLYAMFQGVSDLIEKGYVDTKEIGTTVLNIFRDNYKYVFILIGLIIVILIIKKIVKQVTFWITMLTNAIPGWNNITVVPATPPEPKSAWWRFWE